MKERKKAEPKKGRGKWNARRWRGLRRTRQAQEEEAKVKIKYQFHHDLAHKNPQDYPLGLSASRYDYACMLCPLAIPDEGFSFFQVSFLLGMFRLVTLLFTS
ncbi:hypothetical protein EUGRSUZ_A00398 [Eucalyptus grandis]|uniref:Uncharacterized protein n=2 Tax=Eucalyptus grandis TaxID=71139 RepID=A0ACC3M0B2_EUCGR|nr:hypothetical protein EUGRSUZ_A00398 [Eucalyptus grandis]